MTVLVTMPNGADEAVDPEAVFVLRNAVGFETGDNPGAVTTIWTMGAKIHATQTLDDLRAKFSPRIKLAELTAPNGDALLVSMARVVDSIPAQAMGLPWPGRTVLRFLRRAGGSAVPQQAVRESDSELRSIWQAAGLPTDPFDGVLGGAPT